ncbi:MAG: N-acetyl-gamma-glutamyl-phosphate reductase [Chloroflexi bacterium]|nr:N-acetyl-gamma-glutamyl-phosphate reductase [Chloroflexota bacterium]
MEPVNVGIINVTGYIGADLARLLHQHPGVNLVSVTGRSAAGQNISEVFPHLANIDMVIEAELGEVDLAISALPHGASALSVVQALEEDIKVIDISADFRLKDANEYKQWYEVTHPAPELLSEAVFGLPELNRSQIAGSRLIANPGCYPTCSILALAPALREDLIETDIIIDSKSGVSGAGRTLKLTTHFAETNESVSAYGLSGHRHMPEIKQELQNLAGDQEVSLTFIPHLIPMTRGMLSTCYGKLKRESTVEEITDIYREFYRDEPFVRVVDIPPQTKQTLGSNMCLIHPVVDHRTGRLIVISCIDNLVKGGAGQAVQNMNLMLGLPETMGLNQLAVYP